MFNSFSAFLAIMAVWDSNTSVIIETLTTLTARAFVGPSHKRMRSHPAGAFGGGKSGKHKLWSKQSRC